MNSELYDNKYRLPTPIIMKLNAKLMTAPNSEGVKRAKNLIKGGIVTYQQLKRLKNFFDYFNPEVQNEEQYELAGGKDMQNWVEETLDIERKKTNTSKEVKSPFSSANHFDLPTSNLSSVHETIRKDGLINSLAFPKPVKYESEEKDGDSGDTKGLQKNALAVIFNPEKRFLLLKRSSYESQWMPNKWALVGGGVEEGEDPMDACKREIKEETGLVINALIEKVVMQRNEDSVEHIYVGKYDGDSHDITLDKENQAYGWFGYGELNFLDIVPNLVDYINIALKEYE